MKDNSRKHQQFVIQGGILITFFCVALWLRLPNAPRSFSRDYVLGFVWTLPMLATLSVWVMSGFVGLLPMMQQRRRMLLAGLMLMLALLAGASVFWAYMRQSRPDVALGVAGQMGVVALFGVMVLCNAPTPKQVVWVLVAGMMVQAGIGATQVALQGDIGLRFLGEFRLNPQQAGISVVQAGDVRWLRPYGLAPHPNPYAGYVLVGVLGAGGGLLQGLFYPQKRRGGWLALGCVCVGVWMLGLSFSRGAWLGLAIGGGAMLMTLVIRRAWTRQRLWRVLGVAGILAGMGALFVVLYHPFLLARAGFDAEAIETRAVNERAIHLTVAYAAFADAPVLGVGVGNFPWYATYHLRRVMRVDMKGDNIHNIYLLQLTELGMVGMVLWLAVLVLALMRPPNDLYALGLWGAGVALAVVGLFDHYPQTMGNYNALWWGLLAVANSSHSIRNS